MKNNVKIVVLILVLVEDGLRDGTQKYFGVSDDQVLILVLVEDGLRGDTQRSMTTCMQCLNPCSCGGWSQRTTGLTFATKSLRVLILVLVEDGLREKVFDDETEMKKSLNPCSCGGWSQRGTIRTPCQNKTSLNPCSCGGWSQRLIFDVFNEKRPFVLILVLVEDGLRGD